jgi:glyoxylase-like metal-dependent hydrolase (beta-lactamase superfamily II)
MSAVELTEGVYLVSNSFVNLYLIEDGGLLTLIDTGIARSGPRVVLKAIKQLGREPRNLSRILITHADGDHTGGLAQLVRETGASVHVRQPEVAAVTNGTISRKFKGNALQRLGFKFFDVIAPITPARVDVILRGDEVLPVRGGLQVLPTPGHTPGHTSFHLAGPGVLFAGDSMNSLDGPQAPLAWKPAPVHWNYKEGKTSVARQAALGPQLVCCGHGKPVRNPKFPKSLTQS